jgi:hypothetical protein
VLGLLFYPLSLLAVVMAIAIVARGQWPTGPAGEALLAIDGGNLTAIIVAGAVSASRGLRAVAAPHLAWRILLLPAYWALMSLAAWQALLQLLKQPSEWEKTTHGVARARRTPDASAWLA